MPPITVIVVVSDEAPEQPMHGVTDTGAVFLSMRPDLPEQEQAAVLLALLRGENP